MEAGTLPVKLATLPFSILIAAAVGGKIVGVAMLMGIVAGRGELDWTKAVAELS